MGFLKVRFVEQLLSHLENASICNIIFDAYIINAKQVRFVILIAH